MGQLECLSVGLGRPPDRLLDFYGWGRFMETLSLVDAHYLRSNINALWVFPIGPFVVLLEKFRS